MVNWDFLKQISNEAFFVNVKEHDNNTCLTWETSIIAA